MMIIINQIIDHENYMMTTIGRKVKDIFSILHDNIAIILYAKSCLMFILEETEIIACVLLFDY